MSVTSTDGQNETRTGSRKLAANKGLTTSNGSSLSRGSFSTTLPAQPQKAQVSGDTEQEAKRRKRCLAAIEESIEFGEDFVSYLQNEIVDPDCDLTENDITDRVKEIMGNLTSARKPLLSLISGDRIKPDDSIAILTAEIPEWLSPEEQNRLSELLARVRPVFDDVVKIIMDLEKDHPVRIQDSQSLFGNVHYVIGDTVVDNATFKELSGMV